MARQGTNFPLPWDISVVCQLSHCKIYENQDCKLNYTTWKDCQSRYRGLVLMCNSLFALSKRIYIIIIFQRRYDQWLNTTWLTWASFDFIFAIIFSSIRANTGLAWKVDSFWLLITRYNISAKRSSPLPMLFKY